MPFAAAGMDDDGKMEGGGTRGLKPRQSPDNKMAHAAR